MMRCRMKFRRFIFFISLLMFFIIFIHHDIENTTDSHQIKTNTKNLINDRLRSHAQSSFLCNTTENLTDEQQKSYNKISQILIQLHQQIIPSYPKDQFNGRGIVLTINDPTQISQYQVNLQMIEYIETRLPVQLWYSSLELPDQTVNKLLHYVPKLEISACSFTTAQCQTSTKTWNLNSTYVFSPSNNKYLSLKSAAIISATFSEILFLDINSYLIRNPEYLFKSDPMYHQFGALFFPDIPINQQSLIIRQLLNITCTRNQLEFDSGILLVNKKRVWNALYMTNLINNQDELLNQLFSEGYKDTFQLAFRFLHVTYYMVGIPCSTGYYNGTHFCGLTVCQTDSLGQYIFSNHLNLMKYIKSGYSSYHLSYTRIGLGDPYNHSFSMQYCSSHDVNPCLLIDIFDKSNLIDKCLNKPINSNEIDTYAYAFEEPIKFEQFENNKILISETNNLMSGFISSLFHYQRRVYNDQ